jgi:hypothetical protein
MKITIQSIPPSAIRYDTCGDWYFTRDGELIIEVPEYKYAPDSQFLVALHELVEAYLCFRNGIREEDVSAWDIAHPDAEEPAEVAGAPYEREHETATIVEKIVCAALGINWNAHNEWVQAAGDEVARQHKEAGESGVKI